MSGMQIVKMAALGLAVACFGSLQPARGAIKAPSQSGKILVVPMGDKGVTVTDFRTYMHGEPGKEKTEATVKWNAQGFTVLFNCEDKKIITNVVERDSLNLWKDDNVEFFLDIDHTHNISSVWVHVMCTAAGTIYDEEGPPARRFSKGEIENGQIGWDAEKMKIKTEPTSKGWRAEIMVPWADMELKAPKVGEVWGINLGRTDHPEEDIVCFSPTWGPFYRIHQWGHVVFADQDGKTGLTAEELEQKIAVKHKEQGVYVSKEDLAKFEAAEKAAEEIKKKKAAAENVDFDAPGADKPPKQK